jgi:hypothetical protein
MDIIEEWDSSIEVFNDYKVIVLTQQIFKIQLSSETLKQLNIETV